ncbi:MAG: AAA family ATPase [Phascolarctobacterium sp.]|nr:AAA family ATPase [Phascolarctobacterium sp.]
MTEMNTQLSLDKIPQIVGESGNAMLTRCYNILANTKWPLYIVGPSGSGKSIMAMNLAKLYAMRNNVPAYYVQLSPEQTKTSLILGLRLDNGSLVVKNGIVADCMEQGGIIVVDEATHSVQEILLMFNSVLDRTSVTAIGDKIIYANEKFRIIFCANDSKYAGNVKLPQSFAQRLVSFYFDYPGAEDELAIVQQIVKEECKSPNMVPETVQRYIIALMREMRSNTYPLSVRNAAIAVVLCNLELQQAPAEAALDDYFTNPGNAEGTKRYLAKRILGLEAKDVSELLDPRLQEFTACISRIGVERFKEIILQSFMYYLDVDLGFFDLQNIKEKIANSII